MPTLLVRFPGGRYHATPPGHHVNEGLVEWPPSPWRLLRALLACGYATQGWTKVPPGAHRMIEHLASTAPRYRVPPANVAHSRHYMPIGVLDKGREKTTLVFDAWADVGTGELAVRWDGALDDEAQRVFDTLAAHLNYLGRSESWVEATAIADDAPLPQGSDVFPHVENQQGPPGWEQVTLVAPIPQRAYAAWRAQQVEMALDALPLPEGKKKPSKKLEKDRLAAVAPYPIDIVDCLGRDTAFWKRHGWSQPPGSTRLLYWRRADALAVAPPVAPLRSGRGSVEAMLLALTTPSGSRSALPRVERTLAQAELLHRALAARVGRGTSCPELTGKDALGMPLRDHRHAHVIPLDLDGDRHLDHILVYAPMGLGGVAQRAVRELKRTWTKGGVGELQTALAGQGSLDDLRRLPAPLRDGIERVLGSQEGAREWTSVTPLVLPRYRKRRGKNSLEGQINDELACRGLPPASVAVLPWDEERRHLRHAVRVRRPPAPAPPVDMGFAVRLTFDAPVRGPLALGYGAHFGLGLFAARQDERAKPRG